MLEDDRRRRNFLRTVLQHCAACRVERGAEYFKLQVTFKNKKKGFLIYNWVDNTVVYESEGKQSKLNFTCKNLNKVLKVDYKIITNSKLDTSTTKGKLATSLEVLLTVLIKLRQKYTYDFTVDMHTKLVSGFLDVKGSQEVFLLIHKPKEEHALYNHSSSYMYSIVRGSDHSIAVSISNRVILKALREYSIQ